MTIRTCTMQLAFALAVGFSVSVLGLAPALAQNSNASALNVTGTVQAACSVSSGPLNFPPYNGSVPITTSGSTNVSCSGSVPWEVEYGSGQNSQSCLSRQMGDGSGVNFLSYALLDQQTGQVLGLRGEPNCITHSGPLAVASIPIDGEIPPLQSVPAGSYSDQVVVTIWW